MPTKDKKPKAKAGVLHSICLPIFDRTEGSLYTAKTQVRQPRLELGSLAWEANVLPLDHWRASPNINCLMNLYPMAGGAQMVRGRRRQGDERRRAGLFGGQSGGRQQAQRWASRPEPGFLGERRGRGQRQRGGPRSESLRAFHLSSWCSASLKQSEPVQRADAALGAPEGEAPAKASLLSSFVRNISVSVVRPCSQCFIQEQNTGV